MEIGCKGRKSLATGARDCLPVSVFPRGGLERYIVCKKGQRNGVPTYLVSRQLDSWDIE